MQSSSYLILTRRANGTRRGVSEEVPLNQFWFPVKAYPLNASFYSDGYPREFSLWTVKLVSSHKAEQDTDPRIGSDGRSTTSNVFSLTWFWYLHCSIMFPTGFHLCPPLYGFKSKLIKKFQSQHITPVSDWKHTGLLLISRSSESEPSTVFTDLALEWYFSQNNHGNHIYDTCRRTWWITVCVFTARTIIHFLWFSLVRSFCCCLL